MSVYLFFDESGNLDFSPNGSRYFIFGALTTRTPAAFSRQLSELRYGLLDRGVELEAFHAAEDRQAVRDEVFRLITSIGGFDLDFTVVEKGIVPEAARDEVQFYPGFAGRLLRQVFSRYTDPDERIILITDRLPMKRRRQAVEKAFKTYLRQELGDRPFSVLHHSSAGHSGLQAADYCTWAVYRKWHSADTRSYALIESLVKTESGG